ncbi:sporulation kinase [Priestia taiwanensis]|uniref:histidine kinase n=2 Tax=Priestia taiwanensis TaxID=1347902 RepID=A0A917ASI3_9BACI|nr:sporulation kinase [Priestia taiwanensis]
MKELIMNLLLNILFIMVSVLLYYSFWLQQERKLSSLKVPLHVVYCLITTVLCIFFSTTIEEGIRLNLQHILILVTIFFSGRLAGGILFLFMNIVHLFVGGNDAIASVLATTIIYISSILIYTYFQRMRIIQQVLVSVFITFFSAFICLSLFLDKEETYHARYELIVFYLFEALGTALIMYLIMVLKSQNEFQKRLIHVEKFQLISEMAASISHEIRNPLTATKGFLQLLEGDDICPEKRKIYIQFALEGIAQADEVITNYLTFAKPTIEEIEELHIQQELHKTINLITPLANMSNVSIQFASIDEELYIDGEKQKLNQCFLNLLKNCIEAMPTGGALKIHVGKKLNDAYITIADNGVGMTDEQVRQLGAPFYSTKEKGTGLGMMVVFSILKAMSARLNIASKKNEGTTFTLVFPLKDV